MGDAGEGGRGGASDCEEFGGEVGEFVAVGHPDGEGRGDGVEEGGLLGGAAAGEGGDFEGGVAVFPLCTCGDVFAEVPSHFLEAVANSQDGDVEVEDGGVDVRGGRVIDGVGASGKDDAFGSPGEVGEFLGAGKHFGVDVYFAETAGDEMGVLRSEV